MPEYDIDDKFVAFIREVYRRWPQVMDAVTRVLNMRGPGIQNTPSGITISLPLPPKQAAVPPPAPSVFVVRVRNASGSAGTNAAKCNYTYELWHRSTETQLATGVALDAQRPYGQLAAAPDNTRALAEIVDGAYVLLGFLNCEQPVIGAADCNP
jgi:hypothetical protein